MGPTPREGVSTRIDQMPGATVGRRVHPAGGGRWRRKIVAWS
jgi:hypothetical protein